LVPDEQKDCRYWSKRQKNNDAARMSREARRLKENQIALRAAFLERENSASQTQIKEVVVNNDVFRNDVTVLSKLLRQYRDNDSGAAGDG
jgi:hypothetical protein